MLNKFLLLISNSKSYCKHYAINVFKKSYISIYGSAFLSKPCMSCVISLLLTV